MKFLESKKINYNKTTMKFMINKYIDKDSSGTIDPNEIEDFFSNYWSIPEKRAIFCKDINTDPKMPDSVNKMTLTRQLILEVLLDQ